MTSSNVCSSDADEAKKTTSDFSIEHILHGIGNSERSGDESDVTNDVVSSSSYSFVPFPWLHCTRYCPPKIPRTQKKETPQKRQLGRHPRIPFTSRQLLVLEERFKQSPYLSSQEVTQVSRSLQLADIRVKIWFQNRRARERRERAIETSPEKHPRPQTVTLVPRASEARRSTSTFNEDSKVLLSDTNAISETNFQTRFSLTNSGNCYQSSMQQKETGSANKRFSLDVSRRNIYFE